MEATLEVTLMGAVALVGLLALTVSRHPGIMRDSRRDLSVGVMVVSMFATVLALHVLFVALSLRQREATSEAQANGLVLTAILILLLGSLAFLFSLGVLLWSFTPTPTPRAPGPAVRPVLAPPGPAEAAADPAPISLEVGLLTREDFHSPDPRRHATPLRSPPLDLPPEWAWATSGRPPPP